MPGRRGTPDVTGADGVLSGSLLVRERNRGNKKKGGEAERGEKGGTEGQGWIPIPVGIEGMGKYHEVLCQIFLSHVNHYPHIHSHLIKTFTTWVSNKRILFQIE